MKDCPPPFGGLYDVSPHNQTGGGQGSSTPRRLGARNSVLWECPVDGVDQVDEADRLRAKYARAAEILSSYDTAHPAS
jgi:hypothetical protein